MTAIRFTTPPGWPTPPEGFLPPRTWTPDPMWPAPPVGWQFYRDGYGFPTPAPEGCWQPVLAPSQRSAPDQYGAAQYREATERAALAAAERTGTRSLWFGIITLVVVLGLAAGGGLVWFTRHRDAKAVVPGAIASARGLYDPALHVGSARYQYLDSVGPGEVFDGTGDCNTRSNQAVKDAAEAVAAGTDRGWVAVTWRFDQQASARAAFDSLRTTLNGCSDKSYTFANPVVGDQWVQFDQLDKQGNAYGKVVLTTDANTLTWIVGGREDMGRTAFTAIRKRLAEID